MKTNKLIVIIIFIYIQLANILAQSKEYNNFYKSINSFSDEKIYSRLIEFQRQNPYFSNIYAQLGNVTYKIMLKADPLKDFDQVIKLADNGLLYLELYTHYLADNEARSNRNLYANLSIRISEKQLSNADLISYSLKLTNQIITYRDSLQMVYSALEQSKKYYGKSIDLYKSLNNRFYSLNEVLLHADDNLIGEIKKLKVLFDSTIFYFNTYKFLIKTFTLKKYNQNFKLKPIETFRLDGISNSDFLTSEFEIWDFSTWTDEFMAIYNSEILPLRQEIKEKNQSFAQSEVLLKSRNIQNKDVPKPTLDEKFIFKIGKYDNNSIVRELFAYRNSKIRFLLKYNDPLNSPEDSSLNLLSRKVRYMNDLRLSKQIVDSLLTVLDSSITEAKVNRFSDFFSTTFGGIDGLRNFCVMQKIELTQVLYTSFENLKSYLEYQNSVNDQFSFVRYRNDSIPVFISDADFIGKYRTNDVSRFSGVPAYIGGFEVVNNSASAYVLSVNDITKVNWYKLIEKPTNIGTEGYSQLYSKIFGYKGGCAFIFSKSKPELSNTLVKLDSSGRELMRVPIQIPAFPVYLNYDDINQRTLIACRGNRIYNSDILEYTTICMTDSSGNMKWKVSFDLAGSIVDIVKTENIYQVYLNYKTCNINGISENANSDKSKWGLMVVNIDENGTIKEIFPVRQTYSYHITNIFKLSGQSICLIGYKSSPSEVNGTLYFSIMNTKGDIIYCN